MKKYIYISSFLLIILTFFIIVNANDTTPYSNKLKYELYEERVEDICEKYLYKDKNIEGENIKLFINLKSGDDYEEVPENTVYDFDEIKEKHRANMNNIYKCGLLNIQLNSLKFIKNDLINKNPILVKELKGKVSQQISKIKSQMNKIESADGSSLKCISSKEKTSIQKLNLLHQSTFQTCKYVNYLEYLRENNETTGNLIEDKSVSYGINEILKIRKEKEKEIQDEIDHTYNIFHIAYQAYTEYENNMSTHILLELIRDDYLIFRKKLHQTLNPINQVVYKISNAMKK